MSNQEKEFKYLTEKLLPDYLDDKEEILCLANDLIKVYPQILAEKVWEGERLYLSNIFEWAKGKSENIQVFIREVVS